MSLDQEIYSNIGNILLQAAPPSASEVFMRASINKDGDIGKFEFDFKEGNEAVKWFTTDGKTNSSLLDELLELRKFFTLQNQPLWERCEFHLNLESGKFNMAFDPD